MKTKIKPMDYTLLAVILILFGIGLLIVLSASSHLGMLTYKNPYHFFFRQFLWGVGGIVGMLILSNINYRWFKKFSVIIFIVAVILLCLVLVPGIGSGETRGAKRWIPLGFMNFQPSELMKFALIIFLSASLEKNHKKLNKFWLGLCPYLIVLAAVAGLLLLEPHYSAVAIMFAITVIILFVAGAKVWHFIVIALAAAPAAIGLALYKSYRWDRILGFLNPWDDIQGKGWQVIQSLYALGSGGIFGLGLGQSRQKYSYLPDAHNDFILAILGEELGLIGMIAVMILFAILIWRGIVIATKAPDMFAALTATGITMLIAIQVILNIAIITSCCPVTGMPVPFLSYGGTSTLLFFGCAGILLNISRNCKKT